LFGTIFNLFNIAKKSLPILQYSPHPHGWTNIHPSGVFYFFIYLFIRFFIVMLKFSNLHFLKEKSPEFFSNFLVKKKTNLSNKNIATSPSRTY
jgi:hypothetical protein